MGKVFRLFPKIKKYVTIFPPKTCKIKNEVSKAHVPNPTTLKKTLLIKGGDTIDTLLEGIRLIPYFTFFLHE